MMFLDRQMVLQVLYSNLRDESKVLPSKRVGKVEMDDQGVRVTTKDGSIYTGDILVGADGVHSAVRGEMFRIANETSPGYLNANEENGMLNSSLNHFRMITCC